MNNEYRMTTKEKIYFLLMFIAYCIMSSLDFQMLTLGMNLN
jgi:hypothetical protein